jgi:hypothetical protein
MGSSAPGNRKSALARVTAGALGFSTIVSLLRAVPAGPKVKQVFRSSILRLRGAYHQRMRDCHRYVLSDPVGKRLTPSLSQGGKGGDLRLTLENTKGKE